MRKLAPIVVVLGLVAAACSSDQVVATVNGAPISLSQIQGLRSAGDESIPNDEFSQLLLTIIVQEIVVQTAETELNVTTDEAELEAEYQRLKQQVEAQGVDYEEFIAEQGLSDQAVREIALQRSLRIGITEALLADIPALTEEELEVAYEAQLPSLVEVCARHILLESEADALTALDRLAGGEDFGALAQEISTGPSGPNGGDLGCSAPASYVPEFADATLEATVGEPYGPVQTQFGWHVILVESRTVPTVEEAREIIEGREAQGPRLFQDWLLAAIDAADVEVEPEYGAWSTSPNPTVLPPSG